MPATSLGVRLLCVHQSPAVYRKFFPTFHLARLSITPSVTTISPFSINAIRHITHRSLILKKSRGLRNTATSIFQINRHFSESQIIAGNGEVRSKRKSSPVNVMGRPSKLYKQDPYPTVSENGQPSPEDDHYIMEMDGEEQVSLPPVAATADTAEWQATIERVVRNVVSIHFCQTCAFDTDPAVSSEATGFVVDAEKGYILTNRHVVGAGPFWGYCIFDNHEEVYRARNPL